MPATHNNAGISASCYVDTKRGAKVQSFATALAFLRIETDQTRFSVGQEVQLAKRSPNLKLRVVKTADNGQPTEIGVVLYDTVIITYRNDETFTCNTGGFITATTATRMSQFSPPAYEHKFGRGHRQMFVGSKWADENMNRFNVNEFAVIGPEVKAPKLKRGRANVAHGRIRYFVDPEGNIYSVNDMRRSDGKMVCPILDYEAIGRDENGKQTGDFTGPLKYNLEIVNGNPYREGAVGIDATAVPLDLANAHRVKWGMPEIELVTG